MSKNPLFVGVDVHRQRNRTCLLDREGESWGRRFTTPNDRPGTQELIAHLVQAMQEGQFDGIRLAAEATNWFWFPLFEALRHDPALQEWPLELYTLNPRITARYKDSFSDKDKTDDSDAHVIADRLRTFSRQNRPAPFNLDPLYIGLRFLTRYRYHLVKDLVRAKNRCLNILYLKANAYRPDYPFSDVFSATSQALLREFASLDEIAHMPLEDLAAWLDTKGKGRFADPTKVARQVQHVIEDSYVLDPQLLQPINLALTWSLDHINAMERQLQRVDTAIAEAMLAIPHTLDTIPGFGPVYSAGIIAEIAGVERFHANEAKIAQFAGLHWRKTESADFKADETHLTKRGNPYLRYYFCEAANAVRMRDAEYAAFYQRKHDEVRTHQHRRAVVLTARKLVRLVVRLLTTNQPYQPRRQPAS